MFGHIFSSSDSKLNTRNNEKIAQRLHERASKLPAPFDATFRNITVISCCVIGELFYRAPDLPKILAERLGVVSSDQFTQLYRATIWSLASVHAFDNKDISDLIIRSCEVFAGRLDGHPEFATHMQKVQRTGDIVYLSLKLNKRYEEILTPSSGECGNFAALIPLMVSAVSNLRKATIVS